MPLPAVIAVRLTQSDIDLGPLAARLDAAAPGTLTESHDVWIRRLARLSRSLQACAGMALLLVAAVAAAVIAVATRAGLAARREAIEIVHGLGATDGYIAARFAGRATLLAATGGVGRRGAGAAGPADAGDPRCPVRRRGAAPTVRRGAGGAARWRSGWRCPACRAAAAAIGFLTAQGTVRWWLRRLP